MFKDTQQNSLILQILKVDLPGEEVQYSFSANTLCGIQMASKQMSRLWNKVHCHDLSTLGRGHEPECLNLNIKLDLELL